jgi:photosystem II stability/assembly factor-like uncharacterized protein
MTSRRQSSFELLQAVDPEREHGVNGSESSVDLGGENVLTSILATRRTESAPVDGSTEQVVSPAAFTMKKASTRWAVPAMLGTVALVVVAALVFTAPATTTKRNLTAPPRKHTSTWQLAATLTGPQFQIASGSPSLIAGATCTTNGLCFLSTGYELDYGGGGALYVSKDGGHTWSPVTLPADTAITTTVSCASSTWCAVGAGRLDAKLGDPLAKKPMRAPELLVTSDGGQSWTPQAVPLHLEVVQIPAGGGFPAETTYWPGSVDAVICNAARTCQALGQAQIDSSTGSGVADRLYYLQTSDAGEHWSSVALPEQPSEANDQLVMQAGTSVSMDCPSLTQCVAVASLVQPHPVLESWSTSNGGKSWQEHAIPGTGFLTAPVSCPSDGNCWLMSGSPSALHTADGGSTWVAVTLPPGGWEGVSCSSAVDCWVSGPSIAGTTDAGKDWTTVQLPAQVGTVPQISCSRDGVCVATAIPANAGLTIENEGSLILTNALAASSQ